MDLYINLNNQSNLKRSRKTLIIFSGIYLLLSIITFVGLMFEISFLIWFYAFYFLIFSFSLFIQSKGKHPFDLIGKTYFKISDQGLECKLNIFSKKVIQINLTEIQDMKIKLFEVKVQINNQWESINLEKLSDDNLKSVKDIFSKVQSKIVGRQMVTNAIPAI